MGKVNSFILIMFCNYSGNFLQHTDIISFLLSCIFIVFIISVFCNVINILTVSVRKFVSSVIVSVFVLYNI